MDTTLSAEITGKKISSQQNWLMFKKQKFLPCDLQSRTMVHCMLNKDGVGARDRECMNACDQGDWNGDCAGWDNIQRFAFNDAKELAVSTTKNYLALFCLLAGPNICY